MTFYKSASKIILGALIATTV